MLQVVDWNRADIDWQGRGWDRGLRGIACDGDVVYIAASDELLAYSPEFQLLASWRCPYLKHCHEITVHERELFLCSTGYDSILGFNLDKQVFDWAMHLDTHQFKFTGSHYDPLGGDGPLQLNKLHLNSVHCSAGGMHITGLRTGGMLHYNGKRILMAVELPPGTHNARPFRDGVLFNDTAADLLRYSGRVDREDRAMPVPRFPEAMLTHRDTDTSGLARPGFARGLCVLSDRLVAAGSSPSTVTVYDLQDNRQVLSVNLSRDIRNAIHGLSLWPFD